MKAINPIKAGLALGALFAAWHICWALLVALGWAKVVIDFVFWMYFIKPIYTVQPFAVGTASVLIGTSAAIGFILGSVFGALWNRLHIGLDEIGS